MKKLLSHENFHKNYFKDRFVESYEKGIHDVMRGAYLMFSNKNEIIKKIFNDVDEQIKYNPKHTVVNEELCAHHLRIVKPLLILISILLLVGFTDNILDRGLLFLFDGAYFLWGVFFLSMVIFRGYPLLLEHSERILKLFVVFLSTWFGWMFLRRSIDIQFLNNLEAIIADIPLLNRILFIAYSPSALFGILQFSIPMLTVFLYRQRRNGLIGVSLVFVYEAILILLTRMSYMYEYVYIPIITMLVSCTSIMLYIIIKNYMNIKPSRAVCSVIIGNVLLVMLFCGLQWENITTNVRSFINPSTKAAKATAWDDSYNNVLIRELLSRARVVGKVDLTEDELLNYLTSQWYYEDGEGIWNEEKHITLEKHVSYKMQFADDITLEDILPQHYLNNYRIAFWILKYGWFVASILLTLVLATQVAMIYISFKIHNRLGKIVSIAGSITLAVQNLFYILGNFGYQFGSFGNFPFVSEGWMSITGTMLIAGLVLSAYRFDTVIKE